ncbi:hypothetical protein K6119_04145 [Paracrocinitomix mangrovi]|uniref:hypothetical protein n=1 Tax=Paracrocinitomix mangrovi TaxID=2862509 RepID=UPI001C8E9905|nr:hypothetical protein [Paracrocinitomix mangrovi]UKN02704.1 hypothetical protein K6119_04145 [Paracrocinitomix mangrovi]
MGYNKEIILVKDVDQKEFSALNLINLLEKDNWKETLSIIDRGQKFNWINAKSSAEFHEILKYKTHNDEYIGFTLRNEINGRYVTVNMDKTSIIFTLDINSKEDEMKWFNWYHNHLIPNLKEIIAKVEWRTNYDNEVIKSIEKNSI